MLAWLHPYLVHFAIALVFSAILFDLLALWRTNERLLFAGYWNTLLGAVSVVAAALSGWLAASSLEAIDDGGAAILNFHETFALVGGGLWVVLAIARVAMRGYIRPRLRTLYLAGSFVVAGTFLVAAALGGTLVYGYGVGVSPAAARRVLDAHQRLVPATPPPSRPEIGPARD